MVSPRVEPCAWKDKFANERSVTDNGCVLAADAGLLCHLVPERGAVCGRL
jgi:hypothetical protein